MVLFKLVLHLYHHSEMKASNMHRNGLSSNINLLLCGPS